MINLIETDGGATQEGFKHEWNDCSVRALALAADIKYAQAHQLLKSEGRRDRKGVRVPMIERAGKQAASQFETISTKQPKLRWNGGYSFTYPTLQDFVRMHREGRYIVITSHHALALIDGVAHDKGQISGPRSRVKFAYKVTPKTESKPVVPAIMTQDQINELWVRLDRLEQKL